MPGFGTSKRKPEQPPPEAQKSRKRDQSSANNETAKGREDKPVILCQNNHEPVESTSPAATINNNNPPAIHIHSITSRVKYLMPNEVHQHRKGAAQRIKDHPATDPDANADVPEFAEVLIPLKRVPTPIKVPFGHTANWPQHTQNSRALMSREKQFA